jgi:hypothetical protein
LGATIPAHTRDSYYDRRPAGKGHLVTLTFSDQNPNVPRFETLWVIILELSAIRRLRENRNFPETLSVLVIWLQAQPFTTVFPMSCVRVALPKVPVGLGRQLVVDLCELARSLVSFY